MVLLSLLFLSLTTGQEQNDLKTFDVNLDESPETRWNSVLNYKKHEIIEMITYVETLANYFERKYISQFLLASKVFPNEYLQEIRGAAAYLSIDFDTLLLGNFINEFSSRCSAFVVKTSSGEVILARNLDFILASRLRSLGVNINFYKSNTLLYHSISQAGYFGVATGMRPGSYALSVNQRDLKDNFVLWELINVVSSGQITGFAIRYSLENYSTYEQAVNYFSEVQLIVGEYIIIAGLDQGAVLTRNRRYLSDLWELDEENWFLVQTNYDHWLPQPPEDDRFTLPVQRIKDLGQANINEDTLFQLLTLEPTFRPSTLISAVANPSNGYWLGISWKSFK